MRASKNAGLQDTEKFVEKVMQFAETVSGRHGVMLVGPPASAKTTTYRVLADALTHYDSPTGTKTSKKVEKFIINPKSLSISEFYGTFDQISHEFTDGVLGKLFRECTVVPNPPQYQWIIFDGPVEADWIENLNTVLDDNKKLCLFNGEVILMTSPMRFIFETDNLLNASPATVSRAGMIYIEPSMLGARAHFESWLKNLIPLLVGPQGEQVDEQVLERISDLFNVFFDACAAHVFEACSPIIECTSVQLAHYMLKILEGLLLE